MKQYVKFFAIPFIVVGVLMAVALAMNFSNGDGYEERSNTECTTSERVFDYADKLTNEQEDNLRDLIAEKEKKLSADIVIVTLDETLQEYATKYDPNVHPSQYVMIYADNFYEENQFGYDMPIGTGVMLVDNWYRESSGSVYSWMLTSGDAIAAFTSSDIDNILNVSLQNVDYDPYGAYVTFVEEFEDYYGGTVIPDWAIWVVSIVVTLIFAVINMNGKSKEKTTIASTYVTGGKPQLNVERDTFRNKTVTKRTIPKSDGGGGSHTSSGGSSFGGGGHSR